METRINEFFDQIKVHATDPNDKKIMYFQNNKSAIFSEKLKS